ncbi:MAG TPA: cytochrome c biogenesis protein CcsA [Bacteroidia bacterium]|jgi:cytochrome c-type biogenesis protein CcmF|nr:cytochrome c biogenesis protein CcsA [Bacteroidia bacterium]
MEYIGEHLLIGKIGNVFVILSFVFALVASLSYFFAARDNEETIAWKKLGRIAFQIHGFAVFGIVCTLFIMLYNHYFEYEYVWHHSNKQMPMRYIFSCFWEGQEGSFLLWTFWHVVIGLILQRYAKNWEAPVMSVISLVQAFLATMLLGIIIGDCKIGLGGGELLFIKDLHIGSNPFTVLLREHPAFINAPFLDLTNPHYIEKLKGKGLNPLLQNYWMTIHPPTLFLGFALTVVPFAYAIAGLWKKNLIGWIKPALPWTFVCVAILGTGILMGGAWAYEALSFGGFWAWDPVENASLVPWLTLVGAAHVMLVNKTKASSIFITFALTILTFILILYSTYLTRSGVLGETSVHAFTDNGMTLQLLIYLFFFVFLGIFLLLVNLRAFVEMQKEEEGLWSREFWMFVGAIVLLGSSFQIMFSTSIPVWNKLFGSNMAPPSNPIASYNAWQVPFAFVVTLLIAVGQYFKYKNTALSEFLRKISLSFFTSLLLTAAFAYFLNLTRAHYILLMFSSIFAVVANASYFITVLQGKIKKAGASIAHIGFGLLLLGALISTSKKQVISKNFSKTDDLRAIDESLNSNENIMLRLGDTLSMGEYRVTYSNKRFEGINVFFDVDYFKKGKDGLLKKEFSLSPRVQTNAQMGNVAEPDTRHFLTYDVYTHVTYATLDQLNKGKAADEFGQAKKYEMKRGDSIFASNAIVILDSVSPRFDKTPYHLQPGDIAAKAYLSVVADVKKVYPAELVFIIRGNQIQNPEPVKVGPLGLQFMLWKINPNTNSIEISMQEKQSNKNDFIVMQALIFPYINILWIGCIVMVIGTCLAVIERLKKKG